MNSITGVVQDRMLCTSCDLLHPLHWLQRGNITGECNGGNRAKFCKHKTLSTAEQGDCCLAV